MSWTAVRIEKMKRLFADNLSASAIARKLRGGATKSSVMGKLNRLGLLKTRTSVTYNRFNPHTRRTETIVQRAAPRGDGFKFVNALRRVERLENSPGLGPQIPDPSAPPPLGFTIFQLTDTTCRFPLDERDPYGIRKFCGRETQERSSYCAHHHDRCHTGIPITKKTTATYRDNSKVFA